MTRTRRLLSAIISIVIVLSCFTVVNAGGPSSQEGYYKASNIGEISYYWKYDAPSHSLEVDLYKAQGSVSTSTLTDKTSILGAAETVYLKNSGSHPAYFNMSSDYIGLKKIEIEAGGPMGRISIDNPQTYEFKIVSHATLYQVTLSNYAWNIFPEITGDGEFKKSQCNLTLNNYHSNSVYVPAEFAELSGFQFPNCLDIETVYFDSAIKTIPDGAFCVCHCIKNLNIPNTVTAIQYNAFRECVGLEKVSLPKTLTSIKPDAFCDCMSLEEINYAGTKEDWQNIEIQYITKNGNVYYRGLMVSKQILVHCTDGDIIISPKGNIYNEAGNFSYPSNYPTYYGYDDSSNHKYTWAYFSTKDFFVTFDNNPKGYASKAITPKDVIADSAVRLIVDTTNDAEYQHISLEDLASLEEVLISRDFSGNISLGGCNALDFILTTCAETHGVFISDWTNECTPDLLIEKAAEGKLGLRISGSFESMQIGSDVSKLESLNIFDDSGKFTEATFENGTTMIPSSSLENNAKLEKINIPNTVTTIEYEAFDNCDSLKKIDIPNSVTKIRPNAFQNCASFTDIYYGGTKAQWQAIDLSGTFKKEADPSKVENKSGLILENVVTVHCTDGDIYLPGTDIRLNVTKPTPTPEPTQPATNTPTPSPKADSKSKIKAFTDRLYTDVLGRPAEEEGSNFWCDELYKFKRTGAEVALDFIFSPEFTNKNKDDKEFVAILYKAFFGREYDEEGMNYWLGRLQKGSSRMQIATEFVYSQEWANTCAEYGIRSGGTTKPTINIEPSEKTYAFVKRIYTKAFEREAESEGCEYWANELSNFKQTGEQVGLFFFTCDEMNGYNLSNTEFIKRVYRTFMDREGEAEGVAFWVGKLDAGESRASVVLQICRCDEFVNLCIEARIVPY